MILIIWSSLLHFSVCRGFCKHTENTHVLLRLDNTTAVAYINHFGGLKSQLCNALAKQIWGWCVQRHIWISAAHLPGRLNSIADFKSRSFNDQTEWMLNKNAFNQIMQRFGSPDIDIFASRLNRQVPKYISWLPEPEAVTADAFSVSWTHLNFYAFPPFCLIGRCLQKIQCDQAEGILVVPSWPTQSWYPRFISMCVQQPFFIPRHKSLLLQPVTNVRHSLYDRIDLLSCRVSGRHLKMPVCDERRLT